MAVVNVVAVVRGRNIAVEAVVTYVAVVAPVVVEVVVSFIELLGLSVLPQP